MWQVAVNEVVNEVDETDLPSRSLCTLGVQALGIGFRRSSVDPVDDEARRMYQLVFTIWRAARRGCKAAGTCSTTERESYLPFQGGSCSRQIFHT